MQHLENLWKLVNVAGTVRDMAQETKTYQFRVEMATTLYLHTEFASVVVVRHDKPQIMVQTTVQGAFGWRIETDQDQAGVYVVAKRRVLVGNLSRLRFVITVPTSAFLILKLEHCSLELDDLDGEYHIAPSRKTPQNVTPEA